MARLLARCVRGIEELLAAEIGGIGAVEAVGHREVRFRGRAGADVLGLRLADDVFVLAAEIDGVGARRADLARLSRAVADLDAERVLRVRAERGGGTGWAGVDVSASFLGRRAYNRYDVEDAVGAAVARRLGAAYHSRRGDTRPPAGSLSWRVTLVDDRATVAVRVARRPLHRRPYKTVTVPGTLHPPFAAAMVTLAAPRPGQTLLDPCCGAGTIPIEAARGVSDLRVLGVDADRDAVRASVVNGRGLRVGWARADAGALPVRDGSADHVVHNPPWGRQVRARGLLTRGLWREVRRVLRPGGGVVALLHEPELSRAVATGLTVQRCLPVSLFGAHPVLVRMR